MKTATTLTLPVWPTAAVGQLITAHWNAKPSTSVREVCSFTCQAAYLQLSACCFLPFLVVPVGGACGYNLPETSESLLFDSMACMAPCYNGTSPTTCPSCLSQVCCNAILALIYFIVILDSRCSSSSPTNLRTQAQNCVSDDQCVEGATCLTSNFANQNCFSAEECEGWCDPAVSHGWLREGHFE